MIRFARPQRAPRAGLRPLAATVGTLVRDALEDRLRPVLARARWGMIAAALLAAAVLWILAGIHQALQAAGAPPWAVSLGLGGVSGLAGLVLLRRARPRKKT